MGERNRLHRALVEVLRYSTQLRDALEYGYMGDSKTCPKCAELLKVARKCADSADRALRIADAAEGRL